MFLDMIDNNCQSKPEEVRILLVEDDTDDYLLINEIIGEIPTLYYNPKLKWVTTYHEALSEMANHDVCLLDYRLGDHDGLDLLKEVNSRGLRVPIIFLTGQGRYEIDMVAMQQGAADYLIKDQIDSQILERSIRYAMERARTIEALRKAREELELRVEERTRELREANEALARSSEKIKQFAYYVSHDLKSPTIGIHGLTKRLRDKYTETLGEVGVRYCDSIMMASEQLFTLVEMINLYIASKEIPITLEDLRLHDLCRNIEEEFMGPLNSKGIALRIPDSNPRIRADRIGLLRCLRNLVDNAVKYGGHQLTAIQIEYNFDPEQRRHVIAVRDNGIGLGKNSLSRMFNVFTRNNGDVPGTGLGLAIVKEIIEQHNGSVWAVKGLERGIVVNLSLPEAPRVGV